MKYLIMCEGPNELAIIDILLENDLLSLKEDDLLGLRAYHARQISTSTAVKLDLNIYPDNDVCNLRIGDTLTDKLSIPADYSKKIVEVKKYCTKPELEMLLIIAEGLLKEYNKNKSTIQPKEFAKTEISYNGKKYDNSSDFYKKYFGDRTDLLVKSIKEYKRLKRHRKGELFLADLLK